MASHDQGKWGWDKRKDREVTDLRKEQGHEQPYKDSELMKVEIGGNWS